jgi:hypothetical protein
MKFHYIVLIRFRFDILTKQVSHLLFCISDYDYLLGSHLEMPKVVSLELSFLALYSENLSSSVRIACSHSL